MTSDDESGAGSATKRQFLKGLGLAAGAAGLEGLGATPAVAVQPPIGRSYDVVIMGAGSAGIPAAIFAAARGASVLMVEASGDVGGGIKYSGGQLAAAGTRQQKRKGIVDTPDAFYADIMRLSYGRADPVLTRLYVDHAAQLVDWLEDHGHQVRPDHPILGGEHEPFTAPRYIWAHGTTEQYRGRYIMDAMRPELEKWVKAGRITILMRTSVEELIQRRDGAVTGVVVADEHGARRAFGGRNVLLAAGGMGANPVLFEKLHGVPLLNRNVDVSNQGPYCFHKGKGIELGMAAGGVVRGGEDYTCGTGIVVADRNYPSPSSLYLRLDPGSRPAWEVQVNAHGRRYVREDEPSVNVRKAAQTRQPGMKSWVIFDQAILDAAPPLTSKPKEVFAELFEGHPMFTRAATLAELAERTGLPAKSLAETIAAYNAGVVAKSDPAFGRQHFPAPIATALFYAIETAGSTITTYAGLKVDASLRVVNAWGAPIPNLYAAGETLGMATISGRGTVGGSALTPALTFGRLLGERFFVI